MRPPYDSLRFRLFWLAAIWVLVGMALAGLLIAQVFRSHLTDQLRTDLAVHLEELSTAVVVGPDARPSLRHPISDPRFLAPRSGFYYQVDRAGQPSLRSASLETGRLSGQYAAFPFPRGGRAEGPHGPVLEYGRTVAAPDGGPPLRLSIAGELVALTGVIESFSRVLAFTLVVFAAVLIAGAALQLTYGLRPLSRLGRAIAETHRSGLPLAGEGFPSEIRPLIHDLRALLQANEAMVQRARVQAGNLAHGLRTPLAVVMDEAERLERAGQSASAQTLLEQCGRMQKQIEHHMARSRAAASIPAGRATDVAEAIAPMLNAMARLHGGRGVVFELEAGPDLEVACDPVDFAEVISSLLDNAGKWARSRVGVRWERVGEMARIFIDDDGPGLPAELRERMFAVGERLDEVGSGAGLGLAIARDLAILYGGAVRLEDLPTRRDARLEPQGLRAVVELPLT